MKIPHPTTIDFETDKIQPRPLYPPVPVGVSIKEWGKKAVYYAWGHATDNNCTKARALAALRQVWYTSDGLLFQNGRFDLDVAEVHLGLKPPTWDRVHDTLLLLFLHDPHAKELGLKPSAARILGMPAEERDAVADWLVANQPVAGIRITNSTSGQAKYPFGAYLAYAPGNSVVGPYANGDSIRTERLFAKLWPSIVERGMRRAYDRERQLSPILLDMERRGVRVDVERLRADVRRYTAWREKIALWLRKRLGVGPEVNLGSNDQLLAALQAKGLVDISVMGMTDGGKKGIPKVKMDKAAMEAGVTDKLLAAVLKYDSQLQTCLKTFMEPWLATAEASGGLIYTAWHAVRSDRKGGARTGRFASSPNFQNLPKEFAAIWAHQEAALLKALRKGLPKCPWSDLPDLPLCRGYIIPHEKGHVLGGRDYSQQEPRILAHFEDGELLAQYLANPWIDYHDNAKEHLERLFRRPFQRRPVKNINLGIIYGEGIAALALKNGESYNDTKALKEAIYAMYPGLKTMYGDMRARAKAKTPIHTWGGREYYCEPAALINGRIVEFDYKLVNVLVQGSAADCTKEAMIRYYAIKPAHHHLILTVHDELLLSLPAAELVWGLKLLQDAMESIEFDVPMLTEGEWSAANWAAMTVIDKKGKLVANLNLPRQAPRRMAA